MGDRSAGGSAGGGRGGASGDDGGPLLGVVGAIGAWVREYTVPIVAAVLGFAVAATFGMVVLTADVARFESTRFLVNAYKFMIGLFCLAAALYLYYGPAIRETGVLERLMPADDVPASVVVMYFVFGGSVILTASTLFTASEALATFWSGVGFSLIFALAVGYLVYQLMVVHFGRCGGEVLTDGGKREAPGGDRGALTGDSTVVELPRPIGRVTIDEWHASALGGLVGVVAGAGVLAGLHTEVFGLTVALFGSLGLVGGADPDGRVPCSQRVMRREAWYFLGGYVLIAAGMVTVASTFGVTA